jgi:hypothetical protein
MPIPENPTEDSIKPVLAAIPVPPWQMLLVADKPNRNGHVYTKECLEKALAGFQAMVDKKIMMIHEPHREARPDMTTVIGMVEGVEFDGERLNIQVKFLDDSYKLLLESGLKLTYATNAVADIGPDLRIDNLRINAVYAYPASQAHLR